MWRAGNLDGYIIVPKASSNRFFPYSISTQAQDSEAKIIEYIMESIGKEKGLAVNAGTNPNRAQLNSQILQGTDLKISLLSEMQPCSSCSSIIDLYNSAINTIYQGNTNKILLKYGTNYP